MAGHGSPAGPDGGGLRRGSRPLRCAHPGGCRMVTGGGVGTPSGRIASPGNRGGPAGDLRRTGSTGGVARGHGDAPRGGGRTQRGRGGGGSRRGDPDAPGGDTGDRSAGQVDAERHRRREDAFGGAASGGPGPRDQGERGGTLARGREQPDIVRAFRDAGSVQRAAEALERQGAMVRFLPVDYAFHSPQMEPFARELETVLAGLRPATAKIPFVSTVTGLPADGETGTAAYWRRNVREPVRFADAVDGLARLGCRTFLEIGPHPVLARSLRQCGDAMELEVAVVGTLQREQDEDLALATTLTALHLLGYRPKLDRYFPARGRVVSLPSYPWQRQKYPLKGAGKGRRRRSEGTDFRSSAQSLLGARLDTAIRTFEVAVSIDDTQWLADHRMNGQAIVPAAVLIVFGLEAAKSVFGAGGHAVGNLIIEKPIVVPEGEERLIQVAITTDGPDSASMKVFSRPGSPEGDGDAWSPHASAQLTRQPEVAGASTAAALDEEVLRAGCDKEVSPDQYYNRLASLGAEFGPSFRSVEQLQVGADSASGLVAQTTDRDSVVDGSFIAPGVLDG
ncbi:MAG: acyltransferase domain-containing protein, partial [Deltaproteobacteria bacterium]